ncbi:MAG: hypothetical protein QI223_10870 [Candidatus Korarchaeota archaeon]|nr:hypothetical protein [Candidatus Korarchaeota archaeon]
MALAARVVAASIVAAAVLLSSVPAAAEPVSECGGVRMEVSSLQLVRPGDEAAIVLTNLGSDTVEVSVTVTGDLQPAYFEATLVPGQQVVRGIPIEPTREAGAIEIRATLVTPGGECEVNVTARVARGMSIVRAAAYAAAILLLALAVYVALFARRRPRYGGQ